MTGSIGQDYIQQSRQRYHRGKTTVFTCKEDPRFSFCLYVPPTLDTLDTAPELVVCVHGSFRNFMHNRDAYADFALWNHCVILAPLFPVGPCGDGNRFGYMMLKEADIRYDQLLLAMVEQVSAMLQCSFPEFALCGYSGGGQFANRFGLLHPERLWALSIGAPGAVTLLDTTQSWWLGVADIDEQFGLVLNARALQTLPVHMVVGEADIETWEIHFQPGHPLFLDGANEVGFTRIDRLKALRDSFVAAGVQVCFDVLPNVPHDVFKTTEAVQVFLAQILAQRRQGSCTV